MVRISCFDHLSVTDRSTEVGIEMLVRVIGGNGKRVLGTMMAELYETRFLAFAAIRIAWDQVIVGCRPVGESYADYVYDEAATIEYRGTGQHYRW